MESQEFESQEFESQESGSNFFTPFTPYDQRSHYHQIGTGKTVIALMVSEQMRAWFGNSHALVPIMVRSKYVNTEPIK